MARASVATLLPLDTWAKILGVNPWHFNQITLPNLPEELCNEVWLQYAWQAADRVGREEVAEAIAQAESDLIELLGYYPVPVWTEAEVRRISHPNDPTMLFTMAATTPRGQKRSLFSQYGHVISGGVRVDTLIGAATVAGMEMTWTDLDGDGVDEIARIVLPTTVTDTDEIRVYFSGHDAEDVWEIRPLRAVAIAGGNVTIDIDRYLLADPNLAEALNPDGIDGSVDGNFVADVNVYQVANDPSDHGELQWEPTPGSVCGCTCSTCETCQWATQAMCLQARNPELGIFAFTPATWDATEQKYDETCCSVGRGPDRASINYRHGYRRKGIARPMNAMDPEFARMITFYALTLLDRPICSCSNIENWVSRWLVDRALEADSSYKVSDRDLSCPWGTREGAIWAYRRAAARRLVRAVDY